MKKYIYLIIFLSFSIQGFANEQYPKDVNALVEQINLCQHFAGEISRDQAIDQARNLSALTHAKTEQQLVFTNKDIVAIKQEIENQKLLLGNGPFLNLKNLDINGFSKDDIQLLIKQKGFINVLFGEQGQYDLFIKYLTEITDKNNNFIDQARQKEFEVDEKYYIFSVRTNETSFGVNMLIKEKDISVEDSDYTECMFMYDFKKENTKVILEKMEVAGC